MQNVAFRCGLIASLFLSAGLNAAAEQSRDQRYNQTESNADYYQPSAKQPGIPPITWQPPRPTVIPGNDAPKPSVYKYKCYDPPTRDDADACQQRRSAQAAEDQWWISVWAVIASILAAFFTGWAAWQAAIAAKAAEKAAIATENSVAVARDGVGVAHEMGMAQVRAYMTVFKPEAMIGENKRPVLKIRYANSGQTPARKIEIAAAFGIGPVALRPKYESEILSQFPHDLRGGEGDEATFTFKFYIRDDFVVGDLPTLFAYCKITCEDVFNKRSSEEFMFWRPQRPSDDIKNFVSLIRLPRPTL